MSVTRYLVDIGGQRREVGIEPRGQRWEISMDGKSVLVEQSVIVKDARYSLIVGDDSFLVDLVSKDWRQGRFVVNAIAEQIELTVRDELEAVADAITAGKSSEGLFELKAPMPGVVVRSLVSNGDAVTRGQGLVILEAMKMQNELASELDGIVQELCVEAGQMVETGALLARIIREEG